MQDSTLSLQLSKDAIVLVSSAGVPPLQILLANRGQTWENPNEHVDLPRCILSSLELALSQRLRRWHTARLQRLDYVLEVPYYRDHVLPT
jgi:hypothetical protein